ncbi:MAG: prephenate dehydrogenase/arogenate dehydrogenase family protein [Spirochaetales bacterium]|nr:prephenate dehydrogenase/arogenate dehydrogenase family protein [Spirochaetales bacterium]
MKIGIYGLGRFGSFWARCLAAEEEIFGYSRSSKPEIPHVTLVDLETLCSCDVVILCVAISAMEEALRNIAPLVKPGSLIMDTCSVKVEPVRLMREILPDEVRFLATHPMFGPDSGKNGIAGLPIVVSQENSNDKEYGYWCERFAGMGLRVHRMTADQHDREAAYTQGVTHFIGRVLDGLHLKPSEIGTLGYRKILEIVEQTCNDPYQLFLDLQKYNPYTRLMRRDLMKSIEKFLRLPELQ